MTPEVAQFSNRGMNQDISVSKATNEFAFENYNIRITAVNDNTLLSVTNEKLPTNIPVEINNKEIPNKITWGSKINISNNTVFMGFMSEYNVESDITVNYTIANINTGETENNTTVIKVGTNKSEDEVLLPINSELTYSVSPQSDDRMYYYTKDDELSESEKNYSIRGVYLGHAILNNYLVLFTKALEDKYPDFIYVLTYDKGVLKGDIKYRGDLNFQLDKPIETLPYYESELVQKVYWVDGFNQPRVINIAADNIVERLDTQFDFNPTITEFPYVTITKEYSGVGLFPAGVIQYFISYYNKYGAETGIVWSSDLQYVTEYNRAAGPDETVVCNFKIDINNVDTTYDYARVYSMQRTSLNTTPICRIVGDININNSDSITIIDTNTNTETIDPTQLLFLGGDNFIASTLTQKDDVLFLGDLEIKNVVASEKLIEILTPDEGTITSKYLSFKTEDNYNPTKYTLQESEKNVKTFKQGEWYRFGIQFQTKELTWTTPIWVGDIQCPTYSDSEEYKRPTLNFRIEDLYNADKDVAELLANYLNYRILMAETSTLNRSIVAQGFVNPTMFNYSERSASGPYSIASWITRPRNSNVSFEHLSDTGIKGLDSYVEIQGLTEKKAPIIDTKLEDNEDKVTIISLGLQVGNKIDVFYGSATTDGEGNYYNYTTIINKTINKASWRKAYNKLVEIFNNINISIDFEFEEFKSFIGDPQNIPDGWTNNDLGLVDYTMFLASSNIVNPKYPRILTKIEAYSSGSATAFDIEDKRLHYYVDSSIVTFHSPELETNRDIIDNTDLKFRIVGILPITGSNSDINAEISTGISKAAGIIKPSNFGIEVNTDTSELLVSDFLYNDTSVIEDGDKYKPDISSTEKYELHLWNKSGSIIGANNLVLGDEYTSDAATLKHKVIANRLYSDKVKFLNTPYNFFEISKPVVFDNTNIEAKKIVLPGNKEIVYFGNYDKLLAFKSNEYYSIYTDTKEYDLKCTDPVRIKYSTTPHVVIGFGKQNNSLVQSYQILPYLLGNFNLDEDDSRENLWDIRNLYDIQKDTIEYPWFKGENGNTIYFNRSLEGESCEYPYLYLGEFYRDVDSITLYGPTDNNNLEKITWVPATDITPINSNIANSWGDTYYQRWDCLRAYPTTEEDTNSVVDIVSIMVESRTNLDGRYDKNQGAFNILNARPNNFNKINPVYSQTNNYFTYNILDEKFNQNKYFNQVAFSLQKTPTSEIDTWCNISLASAFNLDGKYGKLNKLITINDAIIAFQDKALSVINFNNRTAISTENGVPIEIANSGKVNGYSIISSNVGCQNKQSICEASSGVYFIDDLNKTMYGFNKEGLSNISSKGMSMWFKKNLTGEERCFYDKLTNDVYITNNTDCLVYNEALDAFTSFMDYSNIKSLFNFEGKSFIFDGNSTVNAKLMFKGDYTNNYYIQYKINPEPLTDKTFTNIEFIADKLNNEDIDSVPSKKNLLYPFTEFEVWNEYQYGITNLTKGRTYPNFERKFRIWRADIPRDKSNGRDRIRNPWIYLKLNNSDLNNAKMAFHSFLVKYYK